MYIVAWAPSAEQDLAEIWNNASDRAEVTAAGNEIDAALTANPLNFGEARRGITRIAFVKPLAVLFDVREDQEKVRVWDIWRWPS
jgi:hypothetical protein